MYERIWIRRTGTVVAVFDAGGLIYEGSTLQAHAFARNVEKTLIASGLKLTSFGNVTTVECAA